MLSDGVTFERAFRFRQISHNFQQNIIEPQKSYASVEFDCIGNFTVF